MRNSAELSHHIGGDNGASIVLSTYQRFVIFITSRFRLFPLVASLVFCFAIIPFCLVLLISFGEKVEGAGWRWALVFDNYQRFFVGIDWPNSTSFLYGQKLFFSFLYASLASCLAMVFAFPFSYLMTRQGKRAQTFWLVFLLSVVSLSEVFVVMGWDILLSNRSGLPMVLREIGLTQWLKDTGRFEFFREIGLANPRDFKFKTSTTATVLTMAYLVWPYAVILLYPALSRVDNSLLEAARTMGAKPWVVIHTVVLPLVRFPIIGSMLLLFVFLMGTYVTVSVFAAPPQQSLTISIYEAVRGSTLNAPFGAAQSMVLLCTAALCLVFSSLFSRMSTKG